MLGAVRTARATIRSLRIYYGDRRRAAAMDRLYGNFVRPGDLVFDVGAHVGDRVASFRRLGARVVAVEPQPAMVQGAQAALWPQQICCDRGGGGWARAGQGAHADQCR